ncbi:MAG: DNA-protecting protein DprA [Rhodoferax sp.]|nr:DNA-protecting protein DprA [Rhodoferax sp.]
MEREELAAWLRLTLTPGVGNGSARKLLAAFGLPESIFTQPISTLAQVVSRKQATSLHTEPPELTALLETTWSWLEADRQRRRIAVLGNPTYPPSLLTIEDPPLMLYLLGGQRNESTGNSENEGSNSPSALVQYAQTAINSIANSLASGIAIVGSRNPTPQGAANARHFAKAFSEAGLTVVSGLALGVDGAAHEGALDGLGPNDNRLATIAVVGTGLDRVYPKSHRDLAHRIAENGLIISEYPLGTPPLAENFPRRNRLIAGLAQGTLVVEAALKSGSLITARLAAEQGKDVFAIPGSIHSTQARGCHALIRQGAKLVESAEDVLEELKIPLPKQSTASSSASHEDSTEADDLSDAENGLLAALGFDPVGLDALQARTGIPTAQLQADLMTLELEGLVSRLPGGLFQRLTVV